MLSLTTDDYYSDPGAITVESLTDSTVQSDLLDLPVAISNLKKAGSDGIVSKYKVIIIYIILSTIYKCNFLLTLCS